MRNLYAAVVFLALFQLAYSSAQTSNGSKETGSNTSAKPAQAAQPQKPDTGSNSPATTSATATTQPQSCSTNDIVSHTPAPILTQVIGLDNALVYGQAKGADGLKIRICVDDKEVGRTQVDSDGNFFKRLEKPIKSDRKVFAQEITTSKQGAAETYGLQSNQLTTGLGEKCSTGTLASTTQAQGAAAPLPTPQASTPQKPDASQRGNKKPNANPSTANATPVFDPLVPTNPKAVFGSLQNVDSGNVRICVNDAVVAFASVKTGKFSGELPDAPKSTDEISAQLVLPNGDGQSETYGPESKTVRAFQIPTAFDFGRVRIYMSMGAVISQQESQFSKSSVYVNFNADDTWYMRNSEEKPAEVSPAEKKEADSSPKGLLQKIAPSKEHLLAVLPKQINSSFESRLTTIPVTSCNQSTNPGTNQQAGCDAATASNAGSFETSPKAALVSIGFYLPYYYPWSSWRWHAQSDDGDQSSYLHGYSLFFAPIAKGGVQTLLESPETTPANGAAPNGTAAAPATPINDETFFHFYATGVRFGLFRFHDEVEPKNTLAPDNLLYLDITYGKYENFWKAKPGSASGFIHPGRLAMEGRFKIPQYPIFLGFDSNTWPSSHQGDLRFIFGTSFDLGCMLQKLGTNIGVAGCDPATTNTSQTKQ